MNTMSAHAHLVPTYQRLRRIGLNLSHKLVVTLGKDVLEEGGRKLGTFRKGTLVFDTEDEVAVLRDFCIYNLYRGGQNAVQRMLEDSPPSDPDEPALLRADAHAYYSIFQVVEVERGAGVTVEDTLRGGTQFVTDVSFGQSARQGYLLAGRVIPVDGFLMSGGAMLPVAGRAAHRVAEAMVEPVPRDTDFTRLTRTQEADLTAMIIRACLEGGASEQIMYATPGEERRTGRWSPEQPARVRANRNDPYPCGSGRKYKSCWGKR
jgi:hypothetical protein